MQTTGVCTSDLLNYQSCCLQENVQEWKVLTSTSPSGQHLGHYKVALVDDTVASIHASMLNLPFTYGFVPS
jgi:hypothetical protein